MVYKAPDPSGWHISVGEENVQADLLSSKMPNLYEWSLKISVVRKFYQMGPPKNYTVSHQDKIPSINSAAPEQEETIPLSQINFF